MLSMPMFQTLARSENGRPRVGEVRPWAKTDGSSTFRSVTWDSLPSCSKTPVGHCATQLFVHLATMCLCQLNSVNSSGKAGSKDRRVGAKNRDALQDGITQTRGLDVKKPFFSVKESPVPGTEKRFDAERLL